ncbi:D-2-hydroxyacid dehydrogenase [Streptomyces odontomachi]|uniref:D-2-hydroxyacid dehydrogenase n=1 Tax=Streptomyces odontomachi TaxID=2944940 RepID=UPI00210CC66F|nr:D-2-hydroxyacid dehydrogenase [Streptomyces sp. ODS25]
MASEGREFRPGQRPGSPEFARALRDAEILTAPHVSEELRGQLLDVFAAFSGRRQPERQQKAPEPMPAEAGADRPIVFVGAGLPADLRAANVLWFHSTNAGVDGVLAEGDWPADILFTRTVGAMDRRIAEYTLTWMLADCQAVTGYTDQQRARVWKRQPVRLLQGETAVVFGAGAIGRAVGRLLKAFGMRTIAVATSERESADFDRVVTHDDIAKVVPEARWLISTLPLTPQTRDLFDGKLFASAEDACFINVGRGATVNLPALHDALTAGRVRSAVLDVLADEPAGPEHPCWNLPRTVITPHTAGVSADSDIRDDFAACLAAVQAGRTPERAVDPGRGY